MAVSLTYLMDNFVTDALSLTKQNYHVLYSFGNDEGKRPSLVNYFFSNWATSYALLLMPDSDQQEKPLDSSISGDAKTWLIGDTDKEELRREVNTWIQEKTRGLIRGAMESIDIGPDILGRIIVGVQEFEGEWSVPFIDAGFRDFEPLCGGKIRMPFMTSTAEELSVQKFQRFTVLSIPYKKFSIEDIEMLFFLPDEEYGDMKLREFINYIESVFDDVIPTRQKVSNLLIPKFTLNTQMNAITTMRSQSKLRSSLTIDEKGTRAASFTAFFLEKEQVPSSGLVSSKNSTPPEGINFLANRPFVFIIRESVGNRKQTLFSGALVFPYCNDGF